MRLTIEWPRRTKLAMPRAEAEVLARFAWEHTRDCPRGELLGDVRLLLQAPMTDWSYRIRGDRIRSGWRAQEGLVIGAYQLLSHRELAVFTLAMAFYHKVAARPVKTALLYYRAFRAVEVYRQRSDEVDGLIEAAKHAELEAEALRLTRQDATNAPTAKLERFEAQLARWTRRQKLVATKIKKIRAQIRRVKQRQRLKQKTQTGGGVLE